VVYGKKNGVTAFKKVQYLYRYKKAHHHWICLYFSLSARLMQHCDVNYVCSKDVHKQWTQTSLITQGSISTGCSHQVFISVQRSTGSLTRGSSCNLLLHWHQHLLNILTLSLPRVCKIKSQDKFQISFC